MEGQCLRHSRHPFAHASSDRAEGVRWEFEAFEFKRSRLRHAGRSWLKRDCAPGIPAQRARRYGPPIAVSNAYSASTGAFTPEAS
jgi:hypothetical protein